MTQGPQDNHGWRDRNDGWPDRNGPDETQRIEVPEGRPQDPSEDPYWESVERVTEISGIEPEEENWVTRNALPLGVLVILAGVIAILLIGINAPGPEPYVPSPSEETTTAPVEETTTEETGQEETTDAEETVVEETTAPEDTTQQAEEPQETTTEKQETEEAAPESPTPPLEPGQITDGTYTVGTEVAPSLYRIASKDTLVPCLVVQLGPDGQPLDERGVQEGDVIFPVRDVDDSRLVLGGCGQVSLAMNTLREDPDEITNGYWLVGQEIAPGTYTAVRDDDSVTPEAAAWQTTEDGIIETQRAEDGTVTIVVQDLPGSTVTFIGVKEITREK